IWARSAEAATDKWAGDASNGTGREAETGPVPRSATATRATTIRFKLMRIFDCSSFVFSAVKLAETSLRLPTNPHFSVVSTFSGEHGRQNDGRLSQRSGIWRLKFSYHPEH